MNCPLPCESYGSFKLFKISASDFGTVSMHRSFCACAYHFLTTVTEGVVHSVHRVVIQSSSGIIQQHKANGGTWTVTQSRIRISTVVDGQGHYAKCV